MTCVIVGTSRDVCDMCFLQGHGGDEIYMLLACCGDESLVQISSFVVRVSFFLAFLCNS